MKIIVIIVQIGVLYVFFLTGEFLQKQLQLPVPGSIVGLLLLFVLLLLKIVPVKVIEEGSSFILAYLPMFFIPATAGIMNHLDMFSGRGLLLIGILVISSVITMAVTAHSSEWIASRSKALGNRRTFVPLIRSKKEKEA